jgi:hypothetical protein
MRRVLNKVESNREGIEQLNTFPSIKTIILCLLVIIFLLGSIPIQVLVASDFKTDEYLKSWRISHGEEFSVIYTHSVQLTPVSEIYLINKDEIILKETYFHSYGAGLPSTTKYKFEITEDGFRIYDINEIMNNLIYRTGAVRANHKLLLGGKEYKFLDFSKPREGVRLESRNISTFKYIIKEGLK